MMNPGGGLSPAQAGAMFRRQKRQLDRRVEMTDKCIGLLETLFEKNKAGLGDTATLKEIAIFEMLYGVIAIQLQQLKLAQAEGKEQQMDFDAAIKNAESPIIGPTHQRGGRGESR
jgi:hypothetical protein